MKADEIRQAYKSTTPCFDPADPNSVRLAQVEVMAEIAAQMAELNAFLRGSSDNGVLAVITQK